MYAGHRIAVVVPALDEADKIARTIASVPAFADHVLVVDDGSRDGTAARARACARPGLEVLVHPDNRGVGAAIATGYRRARELGADVAAVMAGDAQMDPDDLPFLIEAVVQGGADYAKGDRFGWRGLRAAYRAMPAVRFAGNLTLTWLTRRATGLRGLRDAQCGYTAASRRALALLCARPMFPRYGYPNAVLIALAAAGLRVADVPVRPVYGPDWRSGMRIRALIGPLVRLLLGALWTRVRGRLARVGPGAARPAALDAE